MGNYRTKMRQLGRLDVTVNGGKRGSDTTNGDPPNTQIKKPKKGEINFLPDFPEGMNDQNMKVAREVLVNEMMKTKPKESLVKKEMDVTFAFRRKEIVNEKPAISQVVHRWPALFTENQVYYEFGRVSRGELGECAFYLRSKDSREVTAGAPAALQLSNGAEFRDLAAEEKKAARREAATQNSFQIRAFTDIFNISLSSAIILTCFKSTTIVPVLKKSSVSCLNDYRHLHHTPSGTDTP
ncbi:uncharacterized protein LOC128520025 [Clarias gariepinus]|uniref:uncharacterized protein LOC128520025 n=1 Tax=Clarias gariepinus TaxID=13013 RepID=UPI00234C9DE6|nr:uncharacterized protein LOC128520025 [Clarias gariepinus]